MSDVGHISYNKLTSHLWSLRWFEVFRPMWVNGCTVYLVRLVSRVLEGWAEVLCAIYNVLLRESVFMCVLEHVCVCVCVCMTVCVWTHICPQWTMVNLCSWDWSVTSGSDLSTTRVCVCVCKHLRLSECVCLCGHLFRIPWTMCVCVNAIR